MFFSTLSCASIGVFQALKGNFPTFMGLYNWIIEQPRKDILIEKLKADIEFKEQRISQLEQRLAEFEQAKEKIKDLLAGSVLD